MKTFWRWLAAGVALCSLEPRLAWAENEAAYSPADGRLYIPYVKLLDYHGNTVQSYNAVLRITRARGQSWLFKLASLSPVSGGSSTNGNGSSTGTAVNVTGEWDFTFQALRGYGFTGTNWYIITNSPPDLSFMTLQLTQNGNSVSGTGMVSTTKLWLDGAVRSNLFSFTMLLGATNAQVNALSGHAEVLGNEMSGDYFYKASSATLIGGGPFSAAR